MTESDEQTARARAIREAILGRTIAGKYVLRRLIGHGGMGAVYEAEHSGLGKKFAIKFVDPEFATEETVVARFAREARAMSTVESAHIVTVFDAGAEDGRPYLVMELLRGEDLGQRLRRQIRVPVSESMHVIAQVLKGLARAHAAGIIHRDLKPDNVFLVQGHTDPLFAKIVDFGISKIERPRANTTPLALTGRGTVLGTPFYMSPEQAQASSDVDVRADLYSVGAILFECLTGRPPHTGESYEQVILSICMRDAPDVRAIDPKISPEVSEFIARALARDRTQRFTSAERMLAALHEVAPEEKARVPLDPPPAATMLSSGERAPTPNQPISMKTQIGVADLSPMAPRAQSPSQPDAKIPAATIVDPPRTFETTSSPSPSRISAQPQPKSKRSPLVFVTAGIATLTGIGATLAIVIALEKKPPQTTTTGVSSVPSSAPSVTASTAPTITSAIATAAESSSAPPIATSAPVVTVANTAGKPKPKPTATTTTASSTKLDIQRELPP